MTVAEAVADRPAASKAVAVTVWALPGFHPPGARQVAA
jgi:hypothetical protein